MSNKSLLDYPPEVVINILSFLPIQALLRFSETSRHSHALATSSLHTLSLAIYTTRTANMISCLSATQYPQPKHAESSFQSCNCAPLSTRPLKFRRKNFDVDVLSRDQLRNSDPYRVSVSIQDAQLFDPGTLLAFHNALTADILGRHGTTLRNLDISVWSLTLPIAKALAALPALRTLSIRVEDFPQIRCMPRRLVSAQRAEQRVAWDLLTKTAIWAPRLRSLRIEGGEISSEQLFTLLRQSRWCQELWLCKCPSIGKELWSFLGNEWEQGRAALRILGIMRCGGQLDEDVLGLIGTLKGLQFLSLHGCHGIGSHVIEKTNKDHWKIPECVPPVPRMAIDNASSVIEVDPLYLQSDE